MLGRFLLPLLVASSAVAYAWPGLVGTSAFDPFVASKPYLSWLIVVTMFALGWLLPVDEIKQVGQRWPAVLGGTTAQYVCMPALAYTCGMALGFRDDLLLGIVLVGCVPGAMASNVLTLLAGGNTSFSISLTTLATLASPLAVPLVMWVALRDTEVDRGVFLQSSLELAYMVVLPVATGFGISRLFPNWERMAKEVGSNIAALAILWIIAAVVGLNRDRLSTVSPLLIVCLLAVNAGGYLAGYSSATVMRLPESMRRAMTLEIGMQNAGLGATLAVNLFPDQGMVALAPALYTFACMLTGSILAQAWAWTKPAEGQEDAQPE